MNTVEHARLFQPMQAGLGEFFAQFRPHGSRESPVAWDKAEWHHERHGRDVERDLVRIKHDLAEHACQAAWQD